MKALLRTSLVVAAAITAWRSAAGPPRVSELLNAADDTTVLAWAITAGGPSDESWLESARRWSENRALRVVVLATLMRDEPWPAELEAYVENAARAGTGVERTLALQALDRRSALGK